jgi:CxxC motif-containing protein (DUF1111 family)
MIRAPAGAAAATAAIFAGFILAGAFVEHAPRASGLRDELIGLPLTPDLGGATSRVIATDKAYTFLASNAPDARSRDFFFGNRIFNTNWAEYPASVKIFDGLGPTFNRNSCSGCHVRDGRGRPPETAGAPFESMLIRLSALGAGGKPVPHPAYGEQLNDRAILGVPAEGHVIIDVTEVPGTYGDGPLDGAMVSPRVAPAVIGLGLLEAVPVSTLEALADPDDSDGDGISGRINWLTGRDGKPAAGRFGWKANVATLREQAAGAANGDIGLTSSLFPVKNCPAPQAACQDAAHDPAGPDLSDRFLDKLTTYMRTLAVPVERDASDPEIVHGFALFKEFGCAACHVPTLKTDTNAALPELGGQVFHPFSDLLLHDMGPDLADGRPDGSANGNEWRTPPLWGLGLLSRVNGHDRLLHDGRARGFAEAILWHGGEAEKAREAFRTAAADDREALIAFLKSL